MVGLRQNADGTVQEAPVESLLLLRSGDGQANRALTLLARSQDLNLEVERYLTDVFAQRLVEERRTGLMLSLDERLEFLRRGYTSQENELASMRARYREKADQGDPRAKGELTRIKQRQSRVHVERETAILALQREPELIVSGEISFLAHALVLPSSDPQDLRQQYDAIEAIATQVAIAYEEAAGAKVLDVSTPEKARRAGLGDWPGFDLLSRYPDGEEKAIEVKGRAQSGNVDISGNEWSAANNLGTRYWLYVVYNCASSAPRLVRVQDPFNVLLAKVRGMVLEESEILKYGNLKQE
jgi:hypothetical protein